MTENLEFEDVDVGIWTALLEKCKEVNQISREKYGFGWEICEFLDDSEKIPEENHTVLVPNWGEIPPLRELVRTFSAEKLVFEGRENGGK